MICTDCNFTTNSWHYMKEHYADKHPLIENPSRFFTEEARNKW